MSILIIAEQAGGNLKKSTLSAITFARALSERTGLGYDLAVLGNGIDGAVQALQGYGARRIFAVASPALEHYLAQPFAAAVADVAKASGATWVVATGTTTGKDLLPRVAIRLEAGLAADVVRLGEGTRLVRPMWAGNVMAEVEVLTATKAVTVRGSDWDAASPTGGTSEVVTASAAAQAAQAASGKMRFVRYDATVSARPELTEAGIVVSGGRGLKSAENFHILDELADALGGAIGASRAAVDAGYAPNDYQIGQTGKSVAPNLYIAVAISGAIQHLAGMKNSKTIVAINKDPEAPIFQVADYGLVADAFKAVPELAAAIRATR